MTRREWTTRFARRCRKLDPAVTWQWAMRYAATAADEQTDLYGASGLAWQSPEDAADEEDEAVRELEDNERQG